MPSFQDSAFLVLLALLLFGPKGLAKLARELGKLMGEFRRASNEFRLQMEDEFRLSEHEEKQKQIAAMEAAAPVTPVFEAAALGEPEHPHGQLDPVAAEPDAPEEILPIATSGELEMMPPPTGLPVGRSNGASSLGGVFDAIPHVPEHEPVTVPPTHVTQEVSQNG